MTDSSCLSGKSTAVYCCDDVKLSFGCSCSKGLIYDELECLKSEILVNALLIDGDYTCARYDAYACYGFLSSTCAVEIRL